VVFALIATLTPADRHGAARISRRIIMNKKRLAAVAALITFGFGVTAPAAHAASGDKMSHKMAKKSTKMTHKMTHKMKKK
jgi:hypothetical protein